MDQGQSEEHLVSGERVAGRGGQVQRPLKTAQCVLVAGLPPVDVAEADQDMGLASRIAGQLGSAQVAVVDGDGLGVIPADS